ncbi:MAG: hypothetical protein QXU11_12100, partial [Thermoproteota archaeon]
VLKHAKLVLRLRNNGGGPARNIVLEASGRDMEAVSKSLGSIEAGETKDVELILRLLQPASLARIIVKYSDDEGNPYLVGFETMVSTETFWIPEHFEEYTVVVPEHEETLRVFVPGYEAATHIRFYALWDERILGEAIFYAERIHSPFPYETSLSMGLIPIPIPGLGVELSIDAGRQALTEAGVKIMVKSIEPYYEYLGILNEDDILTLTGADKQSLRSGNISSDYRVEPLKPYWVKGKPIVLNATQLALYQAKMEEAKKANPDLDYEYRETVADVRTRVGTAEAGYVTLVYHALKIVGEGPLKTVRVRNFAAVGLDYTVDVKVSDGRSSKHLYLGGKEDAVVLSSSLDVLDREIDFNLTYNGRLVAGVRFSLKGEFSELWRGFWDGLASQAWKIALTGVVMVVLNVASGGTVGTLALKLTVLAALSALIVMNAFAQSTELGQILLASHGLREFRDITAGYVRDFKKLGYLGTAGFFERAVDDIQELLGALEPDLVSIGDFLSRICTDMSLEEWMVLFWLKDAEPRYRGFVWGKAVGIAISFIIFLTGFCHLALSGVTSASLAAKAKALLQGAWNWLTPSLVDAFSVVRNARKLANGFSALLAIFSNARNLGKSIIDVLKMDTRAAMNLAEISGELLEKITELVKNRKISDEAAKRVMELCSRATGLGEEAVGKLYGDMKTMLSKSVEFADEFSSWALRMGASPEWVVETAGELSKLDGEELKGLGEALAKVGDSFENGVKLFDTYFKTIGLEQYGRGIANALAEAVSKNAEMLDVWRRAIDEEYPIYFGKAPDTYEVPTPNDQGKIQGKVVYIYVLDSSTKDIVSEGARKVRQPTSENPRLQETFSFPESDIKGGKEYLILIRRFTVEDFYNKYDVKNKLMIENGNAYFMDATHKVLRQLGPGVLDENKGKLYIDFSFKDLKGVTDPNFAPELKLRVSSSGTMSIVYPLRQDAIESVWIKSVKDDADNTVAELLYAQAPRGEILDKYLLSRSLPTGWKWCLDNEENVVELKRNQKTLTIANDFMKRILDPQTYEKLENALSNDMARIAAIFETPSGKEAVWTKTSAMEFIVPKDATGVSRFYVVWAEGFEQTFIDSMFKITTEGLKISGSEGTITLQADYRFVKPHAGEVALIIDLPYSNLKPAFEFSCDKEGNLIIGMVLKRIAYGEIQATYEIEKCEYQRTYYISKGEKLDDVLAMYKKEGKPEIIGLTRWLPSNIADKPDHGVALLHTEDFINRIGGTIEKYGNEELEAPDRKHPRIPDFIVKIQGKETIWETKTGIEDWFHTQMVDEVDKDAWLVENKGYIAYYYFDHAPSKEGAKKFLGYIRYIYENNRKLTDRVFIVIEGGNPVSPMDTSLDPYILDPFPLPSG